MDQASAVVLIYGYDANDRFTSRWSKEKGTTYYTNDAVGNLTYIHYPNTPPSGLPFLNNPSSFDVSFDYDALNRVTNMVKPPLDNVRNLAEFYRTSAAAVTASLP